MKAGASVVGDEKVQEQPGKVLRRRLLSHLNDVVVETEQRVTASGNLTPKILDSE